MCVLMAMCTQRAFKMEKGRCLELFWSPLYFTDGAAIYFVERFNEIINLGKM